MSVVDSRPLHGITDEFVARLAERAEEAERLRRLPAETVSDFRQTELFRLLLPARFGGLQASFPELLQPIRRMAHGCASSAWTLGFYALHNWMLSLFDPRAQEEVFASGPVLAPAPLAPTGRGVPADGGVRVTGRWSWATGAMDADWMIVGALIERADGIDPVLVVLPADRVEVVDTWHTAGMRATGSHDLVVDDVFVPEHRLVAVADIYGGTAPGARAHGVPTYRWPMVPALALTASMPVLGAAERVTELFAERLGGRVLAYSGVAQKDQPAAQIRLGEARVRLSALRALIAATADEIEAVVVGGGRVSRSVRADARLAAARTVHECRAIIADLLEAAGASAHFLSSPLQRAKRDVDIAAGHVVFDYDTSRELAGALAIGAKVSPIAMI
ncbi:acyl-CoA dehydrogenase [Mycobacterium intracellulare]|uniref:acyl-CoA dehydrogenase n=1 Tax=Mycobacterium intracellulare TaxID=1767 RepID=UPI000452FE72|nr:acyl-CoA dehydrogenase [Mycobacterium intracellulare]ETZ36649.1 acyl-CoA dehydrogenase, C-terminal domain protein [Mycobacterium intracellulare MIN_061107_1834]PBA55227.1 acyl-CoA dehydrogenase [Mycobacterium intracellulare subsp. chimaera]BCO62342.1 acyl-CoA dehydrogenase [Mycobacterium intracellulare]BCP20608.1 acyl-CoA dehydrogenase [Mycobacterium intracellulare]BCP31585.1 acyl-CoA dehydrogenase [Mycobacterium intracellulare]